MCTWNNLIHTFPIKCKSIISPDLPGYLPAIFDGLISKNVAPNSVHIACTNIFLPLPRGPAISTDLTKGVNCRKSSFPSGKIQYSATSCLTSPASKQIQLFTDSFVHLIFNFLTDCWKRIFFILPEFIIYE